MALYETKNGQQTGFVPKVGPIVNGRFRGPKGLEGANIVEVEEPVAPPIEQSKVATPAVPAVPTTNTETK